MEAYGGSQARGSIGAVATSLATATAMPDLSCVFDLHHSSWQRRILYPLNEARDRTRNLMVPSRIRFHCATTGTPALKLFNDGHSDWCKVAPHCNFDLHFSNNE